MGEVQSAWFDDDEFWKANSSFLFSTERWESAVAEIDQVLELTGVEEGADVLDLCCGPGRHSTELAGRGFGVTGVDRTERFLETAKSVASERELEIELVHSDMRRFVRKSSFDLALSLYTSFGYFEDIEDDLRVARNVFESLRDGGSFVIEMMGKEILARIFLEKGWAEMDGVFHLEERRVTNDWSWMVNRWIILAPGEEPKEFIVEHRLYSGHEIRNLLTTAGFSRVQVYGGLDGRPYDREAIRLVALARK